MVDKIVDSVKAAQIVRKAEKMPPMNLQVFAEGTGNAAESVGAINKGRVANKLRPDSSATGAHSVFKRDPVTGKIINYETWQPQTNLKDPRPWEYVKGYDGKGASHFNKVTGETINTPHVHDPLTPGRVRSPWMYEIP